MVFVYQGSWPLQHGERAGADWVSAVANEPLCSVHFQEWEKTVHFSSVGVVVSTWRWVTTKGKQEKKKIEFSNKLDWMQRI